MKQAAFLCFVLALSSVALAHTIGATPPKPVWPDEFSTPFGLNVFASDAATSNASATLRYNWNIQSQVIEYHQRCPPFSSVISNWLPCKILFNNGGIFLSQPRVGNDCCLLFPHLTSLPPAVLTHFNYSGVQNAADLWGKIHKCNLWDAVDGIQYWTDYFTGADVQFLEGDNKIWWSFGDFEIEHQPSGYFQLPSGNCNSLCAGSLEKHGTHLASLSRFFNRMALH